MLYSGENKNDWHYVEITRGSCVGEFIWTNRAGVSWTLTQDPYDDELFAIGEECPYYEFGDYTEGNVALEVFGATESVVGFYGPWFELYTKMV